MKILYQWLIESGIKVCLFCVKGKFLLCRFLCSFTLITSDMSETPMSMTPARTPGRTPRPGEAPVPGQPKAMVYICGGLLTAIVGSFVIDLPWCLPDSHYDYLQNDYLQNDIKIVKFVVCHTVIVVTCRVSPRKWNSSTWSHTLQGVWLSDNVQKKDEKK